MTDRFKEQAREIADMVFHRTNLRHQMLCQHIAAALSDVFEAGRREEREECAKMAERGAMQFEAKLNKKRSDHDLAVFESAASEARSIAAAIRSREVKE